MTPGRWVLLITVGVLLALIAYAYSFFTNDWRSVAIQTSVGVIDQAVENRRCEEVIAMRDKVIQAETKMHLALKQAEATHDQLIKEKQTVDSLNDQVANIRSEFSRQIVAETPTPPTLIRCPLGDASHTSHAINSVRRYYEQDSNTTD